MNKKIATILAITSIATTIAAVLAYQAQGELSAARQLVTAEFNDPASAQFRNDRVEKNGWFCGEVNAKNREGGYVGFKRFVSGGKNGKQYIEHHGLVGAATTDDILELLGKKTALLKARNEIRKQLPQIPSLTESELSELARNEVFSETWQAHCMG